jgi:hypothetical protein
MTTEGVELGRGGRRADISRRDRGPMDQGHNGLHFERWGCMSHFDGTAMETNFRHTVSMTLDHAKFCDLGRRVRLSGLVADKS